MRKGRDGGKRGGKNGEKKEEKRRMKIVATTSLPAVDRPNADRWNAARSRQYQAEYITTFIYHQAEYITTFIYHQAEYITLRFY